MSALIAGIEYVLPEATLSNEDLALRFPHRNMQSVIAKTGIMTRHIASASQSEPDLAVAAARKLFASAVCAPKDIDYVLLCSVGSNCVMPAAASIIQDRLELSHNTGTLDVSQACSGFVYALGLATGLIVTEQAHNVLLLTVSLVTKYIDQDDGAALALFGDAAAATIVSHQSGCNGIGPFLYGTDGKGAGSLFIRGSNASDNRCIQTLFMDGPEVFRFVSNSIPDVVKELLDAAQLAVDDIQLFVFHQANAYMIEELRARLAIPSAKLQITLAHCGNTLCCSIPIALKHATLEGRLAPKDLVVLVGFGVGYSWAATIVRWLV
jgi:3-oxoacyl-[acyl-carrier-protein] synthase-3